MYLVLILSVCIHSSSCYPRIVLVDETALDVVAGVHSIVCVTVGNARRGKSTINSYMSHLLILVQH